MRRKKACRSPNESGPHRQNGVFRSIVLASSMKGGKLMNSDFITIQVPQLDLSDVVPIADGCSNNTNYYTQGGSRSTCCCGCDKTV
jgi:hypothetical protein